MKQYVVDAFTNRPFSGNPAAVCILEQWLPEGLMQAIARENNLSETAFAVREGDAWHLRWFTPGGEVELCGHATLATAFVICRFITPDAVRLAFDTLSGRLTVQREAERFTLDFPSFRMKPLPVTREMTDALGVTPVSAWLGADLVCMLRDEDEVRRLKPDMTGVAALPGLCQHVTAPGRDFDCVTRSFAPKLHVSEDPVCGRGHCHVIPLWAEILHRNELTAFQASERGGVLHCRHAGDRTFLSGEARLFSEAVLHL